MTTDERRARAILAYQNQLPVDSIRFKAYWDRLHTSPLLVDGKRSVIIDLSYDFARAIRESDEAAGLVSVPRASLQSIYDDHMAGARGAQGASCLSLHCLATLIAMIAETEAE